MDDYATLPVYGTQSVEGGEPETSETLPNVGLVWRATGSLSFYASYSEGYTVADVVARDPEAWLPQREGHAEHAEWDHLVLVPAGASFSLGNRTVTWAGPDGEASIPLSAGQPDGIVPIDTAIALLKDMGGNSVKFFPMGGLACRAEYQTVAEACARHGFWLEPTGGIDLDNFEEIVRIALDAGVEKVIPHVYSSIIDSASGQTRPEDVRTLLTMVKGLLA